MSDILIEKCSTAHLFQQLLFRIGFKIAVKSLSLQPCIGTYFHLFEQKKEQNVKTIFPRISN